MDEVEKSNEELAREIIATRPDVDIALVERAIAALRQEGIEPTPALIRTIVEAIMTEIIKDTNSVLDEFFTDEELGKIVEEEFERHMDPETKAANLAEVDAAVSARLYEQARQVYPKLPRQKEEE